MAMIYSIQLWKDPGFTEGCIEVPGTSYSMPTADHTISQIHPSKTRFFSEVQVEENYIDMIPYCYMKMEYQSLDTSTHQIIYAWIDDIKVTSDYPNPITSISFHIDYWRTYISQAEFGSGIIKRRAIQGAYPPQPYSSRFVTASTKVDLNPDATRIWWVIVNLILTYTSGQVTYSVLETRTFPISSLPISSSGFFYMTTATEGTTAFAMSNESVLASQLEEYWHIDPESIVSVFMCPIAPFNVGGSGTSLSPFSCFSGAQGWYPMGYDSNHPILASAGYFYYKGGSRYSNPTSLQMRYKSLNGYYKSSDTETFVVVDPEYNIIGTIPWGMSVKNVVYDVIITATSCVLQLRMGDDGAVGTVENHLYSTCEGLTFNYNCPTIDITSNAWSSYVYSGQRQYEMDSRQFQTELNLVSGLTSGLLGSSGAYASASIAGKGSSIAGKSAGATMALSAAGAVIDYGVAELWANDKMQDLSDYQKANQTNGLKAPGNAHHALYLGNGLKLVGMKMDNYSAQIRDNDIDLYGVHVSEPTSNFTLPLAGPIQIQNLVVKGEIPNKAKAYIKKRLEDGVIIL